ncbi:MAG: AEC family transporter [Chloroflexota bacterium]
MTNLLTLFSTNLLPILLCAAAGYLLAKTMNLDTKTISKVIFYIFSPALVFQLISSSELEQSAVLQIVGFAVSSTIVVGLVTFLITRLFKFDRKTIVAILLTTMFTNAGNYGLSLNGFTFGKEALAYASIYFVCSATMIYTLGVAIASMGKASLKEALLNLLRFPTLYALLIGIVFNLTNWQLPIALGRAVDTLGAGAIPAMLVMLGMQLGSAKIEGRLSTIGLAAGIRLVLGPIIAYATSLLFMLEGPALQAGVTEASMPTAVMAIILASEFDVRPAFVSTVVAASTILSPLTLTPLIAFLGGT